MIPIHDDNPTDKPTFVTWALIAICVLIFIIQFSAAPPITQQITYSFGLIPAVLNNFASLPGEVHRVSAEMTLLTSMFLHGGFMHLAGKHVVLVDLR